MVTGIQAASDEHPRKNAALDYSDETKSNEELRAELAIMRQRVIELERSNNGYYETRRVLHKAVQQYRDTLDHAVLGFFQTTPAGRYLTANNALARLLGYDSTTELMDAVSDIRHQLYVNPDVRDRFQQQIEAQGYVENFEYQVYRKDGQPLWLSENSRVMKDASSSVTYYEGSVMNVTHYKAEITSLEGALKERTVALQAASDDVIKEVAGRQQAENTLSTTQHQFTAILETIPGIVSWISADLRYLGVNRQLAEMFGRAPEEFVGQHIGFLNASSKFNDFIEEFFKSPDEEAVHEFQANVKGQNRTYLIVVQKYINSDDRHHPENAAFAVGIDVTERQKAEKELRSTKDQLQAALDAVPGIVSWIDADLRYLGVNRHLANLFSLPVDAFTGKNIGFLHTSPDFVDFVQDIFDAATNDASREISAVVNGDHKDFLIMAQKYDEQNAVFTVGIDITEKKQAAKALQEAESKYRSIFNSVADGIFQTSPDGQYLSANPALAQIYGYNSPEDLISSLTSIHKQLYVDIQRRNEFVRLLDQHDEVMRFESQVYRKDGKQIWISENARAVRDKKGLLLHYEGTVKDITERKHALEALERAKNELASKVEERTQSLQNLNAQLRSEMTERSQIAKALRTSEAELKALFAAMTDYIAVFDAQGRYQKILDTNSELLYDPSRDRIGQSVYDVLPPEQATLFMITIQRALNTGKTITLDYTLPIHVLNSEQQPGAAVDEVANAIGDGMDSIQGSHHYNHQLDKQQDAWFSASISPLPDNRVMWVARDITQQKISESALITAEAKYRGIVENATDGIFQTTPDGYFLSANPALLKIYGYESLRSFMEQVGDVSRLYVNPERRKQFVEQIEIDDVLAQFESQIHRGNGEVIWISENARTVRDDEGNILYYEGIVQDVTVRKQAELALQAEQEKSEKLLLNVLPQAVANRLKQKPGVIAERFDNVTVLFADIVDFTSLAAEVAPGELVAQLNRIFSLFDQLSDRHDLEKIKTIGDAYMVVGGLPTATDNHAEAIADMALDMQSHIGQFKRTDGSPFQLRIGIHTGPVVAGVIGIRKFIYDLWGDTVNVASRMESKGSGGGIQVTTDVYEHLKDCYRMEERGLIDVKGKGQMQTYWLKSRINEHG
ncbi:MAG: adenylate/guanylate cyclase domain-containing protein [Cyanobacteria bacterium P01_F01_bin.150]